MYITAVSRAYDTHSSAGNTEGRKKAQSFVTHTAWATSFKNALAKQTSVNAFNHAFDLEAKTEEFLVMTKKQTRARQIRQPSFDSRVTSHQKPISKAYYYQYMKDSSAKSTFDLVV